MERLLDILLSLTLTLPMSYLVPRSTKLWVSLPSAPDSLEEEVKKSSVLVVEEFIKLLLAALFTAHSRVDDVSLHIDIECITHDVSYNKAVISIDPGVPVTTADIGKHIEQAKEMLTEDIGDILSELANAHFHGTNVGGDSRYEIRERD